MKRYVTIICNPKKVWSRNYIAWSWATVQMARAAHRKQLLTGSVIAVKGVSRWSLDEHISFRGESEKVRRERPSPGRQTLFRRNPAGCRIIDSKNRKIVHKINSCDHRGLIRYWSECSQSSFTKIIKLIIAVMKSTVKIKNRLTRQEYHPFKNIPRWKLKNVKTPSSARSRREI